MALALPDQPSIAVLPFENLSGDPEQGYFVDGMVEEIITAQGRVKLTRSAPAPRTPNTMQQTSDRNVRA